MANLCAMIEGIELTGIFEMGIEANPQRFSNLIAALHEHAVERCLPYPGMADVPDGYSRFAQQDAMRHEQSWEDSCPAYALALLTFGSYRLPEDNASMEVLWDELGGASTRLWPEVSSIIERGWKWLEDTRAPALRG